MQVKFALPSLCTVLFSRFSEGLEAKALKSSEKYYILRPEVLEGWFYLWRYTKDQKYRDWAWDMVQVSLAVV